MNELIGEIVAPVSLKRIALIFVTKAAGPQAFVKLIPWKLGLGSVSDGNFHEASQSNFPPSTITPPIVVPCPPMNFVAECTTMSAPYSIGLTR